MSGERALRAGSVVARTVIALAIAAAVAGCSSSGDGNGGPAEPTGLALSLDQARLQLARETEVEAAYTYAREDPPACDWFVDGVLGGSSQKGTITQGNPATYTAPSAVPAGGRVTILAVSRDHAALSAADTLEIVFTIKYVDAGDGSDTAAGGAWVAPFKTVSYALDNADAGDTVYVRPGVYDQALGEDTAFHVPSGITLRGAHRDSCTLVATDFGYLVRPGEGVTIEHFTVVSAEEDPWHGIYIDANQGWVRDVRLNDAFTSSAVRIELPESEILFEDCEIVNTVNPGVGRGFEIIQGTHSTLRNVTVGGWGYGIMVSGTSDPIIEGCTITGNSTGIIAYGGSGLISQPDVGGGARGCLGGNTIRGNTQVGLKNRCDTAIWAQNNTWDNDPPTEGEPYPCDLENTGGGSIIWY
jgi:parallel beta-helix repeat protein